MNCFQTLKEKGYNLQGYTFDTIFYLQQTETDPDECEALMWYLEATYG